MKNILYVGYYGDNEHEKLQRRYSLAAARKMNFIAKIVTELGYNIQIISPAGIITDKITVVNKKEKKLDANIELITTPSLGGKNKLLIKIQNLVSKLWTFEYLLSHANSNTIVIFYHNYAIALPIIITQKIKKFKLLPEIEEKYSMVWKLSWINKWKENMLLKNYKKNCLVVSDTLARELNISNPIISYGNYYTYQGKIPYKSSDRIQLIFSGQIDSIRGGAYNAIELFQFLSDEYTLKITGQISQNEENKFFSAIDNINKLCNRTACEYLGILNEEEFTNVMLNSHIALNIQNFGEYSKYLFPSKIITYLSYNLVVISTPAESIIHSALSDEIIFSDDYSVESIVNAVKSVDINRINLNKIFKIDKLRLNFKNKLRYTLQNL